MDKKTLIWANIRGRKGGFISILLLMFMVSFALTTVISVTGNIGNRWTDAAEATGVGDLNTFTPKEKLTDEMLSKIRSNPHVEKATKEDTLTCDITIGEREVSSSILWGVFDQSKVKYNVYNEAGNGFISNPDACEAGKVYVPISMKEDYKCKVGDKITFHYDGKTVDKTIQGFIEEPFIGAQTIGVKYALMSPEDFKTMSGEVTNPDKIGSRDEKSKNYLFAYELVRIFQKDSSKLSVMEFKKQLNKETHVVDQSFASMTANQSKNYTEMFTSVMSGILYVFAVLLFGIVLVVIGHSITSSIEMDYVNIGVLRACGFTIQKLRIVFLIQYLLVEVAGVLLGIVASIPATGYVCSIFVPITGLLASSAPVLGKSSLVLVGLLLVACAFIFLKTRRIAKVSPVEAISGGKNAVYFSNPLEVKVNGRLLNVKMAIRQLCSNGKQYISVIVIAGLLAFFMLAMGSIKACMNADSAADMFGMIPEHMTMNCHGDKEKQKQAEDIIQKVVPIDYSYQTTNEYFSLDGQEYMGMIYSDSHLFSNTIQGREPKYDNEIVITEILADETGLEIGDTVEVTHEDKTCKMIVSGTYQATNDAGLCFGLTLSAYQKNFDSKAKLNVTSYVLKDEKKAKDAVEKIKEKFGEEFPVENVTLDSMMNNIIDGVDLLTYIVYIASILFILIVAAMVCGKVYKKEQVDLGVYRTLGFTATRLRIQFALRFLLVACAGMLIGFGASFLWNNALMNQLFRSVGVSRFETEYTLVGVMVPIIAVGVGFFVFAYLFSRKVRKVNVRSLSNE